MALPAELVEYRAMKQRLSHQDDEAARQFTRWRYSRKIPQSGLVFVAAGGGGHRAAPTFCRKSAAPLSHEGQVSCEIGHCPCRFKRVGAAE